VERERDGRGLARHRRTGRRLEDRPPAGFRPRRECGRSAAREQPAVARRAYIDPRAFDRYLSRWTIAAALDRIGEGLDKADDRVRARIERAVVDLLADNRDSPALERQPPHKG
jgi:hypothetical protein